MPGFSICLIILDMWQCFEYASGIKYARILNMLQYNYNSISIIVTNIVILEVLSARFVHPGSPQPTTLFFFNTSYGKCSS